MVAATIYLFFFFIDTAPPEFYPLPLPDALPICLVEGRDAHQPVHPNFAGKQAVCILAGDGEGRRFYSCLFCRLIVVQDSFETLALGPAQIQDRKSTRLNSSHSQISYAVFCLKKK